jgi:hypothetical protein
MAEYESKGGKGHAATFCVLQERTLAPFNERSPEQVIHSQKADDDSMLSSLEAMVKAARAGKLEGRAALQVACVAW